MTITYRLSKAYQAQLLEAAEPDPAAGERDPQRAEPVLKRLRARLNLYPNAYVRARPQRDARTTA